ncbi:MAG TPA: hypothetical protein VK212_06915 [Lentimicrobium sp.]|nr:hypothetical protein [Lentimicrobium sp.]
MKLDELLTLEPSRKNIDQIISIIKTTPELFNIVWEIYLMDKNPQSRRAAWAIDLLHEQGLELDQTQMGEIIKRLPTFKHQGMKRHSLRILASEPVANEHIGTLADICFRWLEANDSSVAVKMYAIKILTEIAEKEPAICRELIDIIELQLEESTPGFRNIGIKTIKLLQRRMSGVKKKVQ